MASEVANSENPDQTPHFAASDLGLHCLPITLLGVSQLQWVNEFVLRFYGPVNPMGSCSSAVSLPNHFYWTGLVLQAVNQYCAHSFTRN